MQAKNLPSFPWENLLDWYDKSGRHDLPWRKYEEGSMKSEVGSRDKEVPVIARSFSVPVKNDVAIQVSEPGNTGSLRPSRGQTQASSINNQASIIYRVWLSEILLQQTQASRVVDFFNRMIERFPTIESLANTDYETFFPYYQGLGYYSRARNILRTAKIIHEEYHDIFPTEGSLLVKLPGVGPYTAEAIRAFGYGIPTLSWDTNLEKVFARYYHGTKDERLSKKEKSQVEEDFYRFINSISQNYDESCRTGVRGSSPLIKGDVTEGQGDLVSEKIPPTLLRYNSSLKSGELETFDKGEIEKPLIRAINNALMDFSAMVDLGNPANINWSDYPIQSGKFYETRGSLEPQETKKSITFPTPDATIIVILHENHKVYYSSSIRHPELVKDPRFQKHGFFVPQNDGNEESGNGYSPFVLPPSLSRDTREYVKSYFREKYGLELSVRPPHRKWLSEGGQPYIAVNAQIQVGEIKFEQWSKRGKKLFP